VAKHGVCEKFASLKEHSVLKKVNEKKEFLWCFLGLALVFHGTQFSRMLLCFQFFTTFCRETLCPAITGLYNDFTVACEKAQADDAGDEHPATSEDKSQSKMSAKRDAKKAAAKATEAISAEKRAATMAKLIKAMSTEKVATAAYQLFAAFFALHLIFRGGLAQSVLLGYLSVQLLAGKIAEVIEFPGHEDMQAWTELLVKGKLYVVFTLFAMFAPSFVLALQAAALGLQLLSAHGLLLAKDLGKEEKLQGFLDSKNSQTVAIALAVVGSLWQMWALSSGMAWYIKGLYLPGVLLEGTLRLV